MNYLGRLKLQSKKMLNLNMCDNDFTNVLHKKNRQLKSLNQGRPAMSSLSVIK